MTVSTDFIAPGHVYSSRLKSGIERTPTMARLWMGGRMIVERPHQTDSAWTFWHTLRFATLFPEVSHWWFRDAWTGNVRFSPPEIDQDEVTLSGFIQYNDEPGQIWTMSEGDPIQVTIPLPLNHVQPVNIPLRLALARYLFGIFNAERDGYDLSFNTPIALTSLVKRDELAQVFATTPLDIALPLPLTHLSTATTPMDLEDVPRAWELYGINEPLRSGWCRLMGLVPPPLATLDDVATYTPALA